MIPAKYSRRQMLKLAGAATMLGALGPIALVTPSRAAESKGGKMLVVYFSMPETDNPKNMTRDEDNSTVVINGKVLGNTQYIAQLIQAKTGADIFRIEPQKPYLTDHRTLVQLAKEEKKRKERPALAGQIENLDMYETVFIGYPNWWADLPMVLYTFLETHDLSGKIVIPVNTHGGSGFSSTISTIAGLQPNARIVRDGFTVSRNVVANAEPDVEEWLVEIGYKS
jgi:flavodoxin